MVRLQGCVAWVTVRPEDCAGLLSVHQAAGLIWVMARLQDCFGLWLGCRVVLHYSQAAGLVLVQSGCRVVLGYGQAAELFWVTVRPQDCFGLQSGCRIALGYSQATGLLRHVWALLLFKGPL